MRGSGRTKWEHRWSASRIKRSVFFFNISKINTDFDFDFRLHSLIRVHVPSSILFYQSLFNTQFERSGLFEIFYFQSQLNETSWNSYNVTKRVRGSIVAKILYWPSQSKSALSRILEEQNKTRSIPRVWIDLSINFSCTFLFLYSNSLFFFMRSLALI